MTLDEIAAPDAAVIGLFVAVPGQNVEGHDFASSPVFTSSALRTAVTLSEGRRRAHALGLESPAQHPEVDSATQDHANAERNGK